MLNKEKLIAMNSHFQIQYEDKQECYVLLYPEGMVQLNQTSGEILNLCDGKNNINNIILILASKFNIKATEIEDDIIEFIEESLNKKWVNYVK